MSVPTSSEEYHYVVEQSGQRAECCHYVCVSRGAERAFGHRCGLAVGYAGVVKPADGADTRVDFYGERYEAE